MGAAANVRGAAGQLGRGLERSCSAALLEAAASRGSSRTWMAQLHAAQTYLGSCKAARPPSELAFATCLPLPATVPQLKALYGTFVEAAVPAGDAPLTGREPELITVSAGSNAGSNACAGLGGAEVHAPLDGARSRPAGLAALLRVTVAGKPYLTGLSACPRRPACRASLQTPPNP